MRIRIDFKTAFVVVTLLGLASYFGGRWAWRSWRLSRFKEAMETWRIVQPRGEALPAAEAYVTGKLLPITRLGGPWPPRGFNKGSTAADLEDGEIDDLYFELPGELAPQGPDDVGSLAFLWWSSSFGQQTCMVQLWDLTTQTYVAVNSFTGDGPSQVKTFTRGSQKMGPPPYEDVIDWLQGLPRKGKEEK